MGKKARKPAHASERGSSSFGIICAIAAAAVAVAAYSWSRSSASAPADTVTKPDGLGPKTMQAQQPLVGRLLELLQEVEQFKDDNHKAERRKASARMEQELNDIEAKLGSGNSVDKQSVALISVVRSALHADRDGWKDEDWNDETLVKQHGLVTYASQTYWDEAYEKGRYGDSYDWYGAWSEKGLTGTSIGDAVRPLLAKDAKILMLGCGNSNMSVLMHEEGYKHIDNADISEPVIAQMNKSYGHIDGLSWNAMDASALPLADGAYDAVIEKGLFDALFAGTGALTEKVLAEARRVLRPGGSLVSITFSGERLRTLLGSPGASQSGAGNEVGEPGLSCKARGEIQYPKAKSTHSQKDSGQTFFVYKCDKP